MGLDRARLSIGWAVATPIPELLGGVEYLASTITINHAKTVGSGACGGCLDPVVLFLSNVQVFQGATSRVDLYEGANYSGSRWVSWQMGYPMNIFKGCDHPSGGLPCPPLMTFFDVVPYSVTAARRTTWGAVKALYR